MQADQLRSVCLNTRACRGPFVFKPHSVFCVWACVSDVLQSPIWNTNTANNVKSPFRSLSDSRLCLLRQKRMWILKVSLVLMLEYLHDVQLWTPQQCGPGAFFKINTGSPPCFHFQLPAMLSIMVWTVEVMSSQPWSLFSHLDYRPTKGGLSAVLWTF